MNILVTAGPTREPIDAVRFLSNASSGKLGYAIAAAAKKAGHRVTLVSGPVDRPDPAGVKTVRVNTALEMQREVNRSFPKADAVLMTAAVADYRPASPTKKKKKKTAGVLSLRLVPNPDILQGLGRRKGGKILVGFALEVQDAKKNALLKMKRKNLDYVVLNSPKTLGAGRMNATVYRDGLVVKAFRNAAKESVARWLIREIGQR